MQEVTPDPLIGSTIDGRYQVLSLVAHGGMSTVYLAKDLRLERQIALKLLPPNLAADRAFIVRLQREAQSAASLSHPHVVQIHDHGVSPQHAYLVYEYIDGHTLRDVINDRGAMSPRQALDLLDPIVEGLAAAHNAGIVHRDVKPENVLISRQGWVKIGDFGLAHAATTANHTTNPLGTVGYVPPEVAHGHGGDARSDIYSAGIMLYELLTGVQPFRNAAPVAVVMAHLQQPVPAPSIAVPGLASDMDELVRFMTEKDPDHRPANGAALLEDLRHIRAILTPEQLDFNAGSATSNGTPPIVLASNPQSTEVISPSTLSGEATTVIASPQFPTSVLPPSHRLYTEEPNDVWQQAAETSALPYRLSQGAGAAFESSTSTGVSAGDAESDMPPAKESKRQAALKAKARAREAATPTTTLGPAKPKRRALLWILLVLVLSTVAATAGWYLALGPGALASIPEVHNKSVAQAQDMLRVAGFEHTPTAEVFDEKVAAGLIVNTDPPAGNSIRKFQSITLHVSRGPVLYPVPELVGAKLEDAKNSLTDAHLQPGTVTEAYDEKVPAGVVLAQDPAAEKEFRANTKINLSVSKGPKPIPVPAVAGMTEADATAALKAVGLVAAVAPEQVNSKTVAAGSVLSQAPDGGELTRGGTVTLTLSKGPKMIEVPSVVGQQVGAATAELKALGFEVKIENLLGGFFGTVRFQDPEGIEAPEGSIVTLKII